MRNWLAVGVVFGVVGVSSGGCSSGTPDLTPSDYCNQRAEAECNSAVVSLCEVTQAACVSTRNASCLNYAKSPVITNGSRVFNAGNVGACIQAINSAYGSLGPTDTVIPYSSISGGPGNTGTVDYLCDSVFQGAIHQNGTCTTDFDCADSNNVCTPAIGNSKSLVCAPLIQINDGQPCGGPGDVCPAGDSCQGPNSNGEYLCEAVAGVTLGGQGAACTSDADCDPTKAGFCDIYNKTGCQANLEFATADCELYGKAL